MADPKWTVMVFMAAEPDPGAKDLSKEAEEDIKEMQSVGSGGSLNLFFQLHSKGTAQRRHVQKDGQGERRLDVVESERDATNGNALIAFIRWALREAQHGPGDYSMLVLWGHAYQFAFGHAVTGSGIDGIDFGELADVFKKFQAELFAEYQDQFAGGGHLPEMPKLNIVGFDACDIATLEVCYQVQPFAEYLLASEMGVPLPGWPYDRVLDRIRKPQGRLMGPAELGTYIVRRFCEQYHAQDRAVSLTLLDLSWAAKLVDLTEVLARKLAVAVGEDADELERMRNLFLESQTFEGKPFIDVADLCVNLLRNSSDLAVRQAAEKLGDVLMSPAPVPRGQSEKGTGRPFIAEHGSNGSATAKLHGVSLYAPHVAPDADVEASTPCTRSSPSQRRRTGPNWSACSSRRTRCSNCDEEDSWQRSSPIRGPNNPTKVPSSLTKAPSSPTKAARPEWPRTFFGV